MKKIILNFILTLVLFSFVASAFSVTAPNLPGQPILIQAGETKEVYYVLQNMVGGEDFVVKATLLSAKDIASLPGGETYPMEFKTRLDLPIKLTIPANTPDGTKYDISLSFRTLPKDIDQPVQISTELQSSFTVVVGKEMVNVPTAQATKIFLPLCFNS